MKALRLLALGLAAALLAQALRPVSVRVCEREPALAAEAAAAIPPLELPDDAVLPDAPSAAPCALVVFAARPFMPSAGARPVLGPALSRAPPAVPA